MKKQLLVASVLLMMTLTASFAQGDQNFDVPNAMRVEQTALFNSGANWRMNVGDAPLTAQRGQSTAALTLERNALVSRKTAMGTSGDDIGPQESVVWSIPLSGSVKEVAFTGDGNLVVYDTANKVLWQSNTAGQGVVLKYFADGVLEVYGSGGQSLWRQ